MVPRTIALKVAGVALDDTGDSPTVILKSNGDGRRLSVPVGAFEASAIIIEIEGIKPPRPLTHDLFAELFSRHGCRFVAFDLYGRGDEGFLGRILYRKGFRSYSMEVRPSDGIALALRLDAPIRADEDLFDALACGDPAGFSDDACSGAVLYLESKACGDRA